MRIAQLVTHFHKNSSDLFGLFVTMPYKISSANIANLSFVGESFYGKISRGGREFSMEGELDFPTLFKNDQQLNKKQVFSNEGKKQYYNLKRTENVTYMRWVASPQ